MVDIFLKITQTLLKKVKHKPATLSLSKSNWILKQVQNKSMCNVGLQRLGQTRLVLSTSLSEW